MIPAAAEALWGRSAGDAGAPSPAGRPPPMGEVAAGDAAPAHQLPPSSSARAWADSPSPAGVRGGGSAAWSDENRAPAAAANAAARPPLGPSKAGPRAAPAQPTPSTSRDSSPPPDKECWTFSCSGWLFVYTFGVVKALKELGLHKSVYAIGTSGGACAASYLFFSDDASDVDRTVDYIAECAVYARSHWRHPFRILACLEGAMDRFQPGSNGRRRAGSPSPPPAPPSPPPHDTHAAAPTSPPGLGPAAAQALAGNLEVSVTTLPFLRNARVRDFAGPDELKAAMLASACAIPVTPVWLPQARAWCIDGAVSDLRVLRGMLLGRRFTSLHAVAGAVSVSPFYASRADIVPSAFVPPHWGAYPPEPAKLRWLFRLGFRDALAWLDANGRLPTPALEAAAGDDADHPPPPGAPGWRAVLWEVRHLDGAAAARAARLAGRGGAAGAPSSSLASSPDAAVPPTLPRLAVRLVWGAVAVELLLALAACAFAVAAAPFLRDVPPAEALARFRAAAAGVTAAAGGLMAHTSGKRRRRRQSLADAAASRSAVEATLREHSAVWRWLRFCL